jgi:hypothetical protein
LEFLRKFSAFSKFLNSGESKATSGLFKDLLSRMVNLTVTGLTTENEYIFSYLDIAIEGDTYLASCDLPIIIGCKYTAKIPRNIMTWYMKCRKTHFQQVIFLFYFVKNPFIMQDSVLNPQQNEYPRTNKEKTLTVGTYLRVAVCLYN